MTITIVQDVMACSTAEVCRRFNTKISISIKKFTPFATKEIDKKNVQI